MREADVRQERALLQVPHRLSFLRIDQDGRVLRIGEKHHGRMDRVDLRRSPAYEWLRKALTDRVDCMIYLQAEPLMGSLRQDALASPRWTLEPEQARVSLFSDFASLKL
jgi:hypothetical protein